MKKTCSIILAKADQNINHSTMLRKKLQASITNFGIKHFVIGTGCETELKLFKYLVDLRSNNDDFEITAVISSERQIVSLPEEQRNYFFTLMTQCSKELLLTPPLEELASFYQQLVMLDLADIVFFIGRDHSLEQIMKKNEKRVLKFNGDTGELKPDLTLVK